MLGMETGQLTKGCVGHIQEFGLAGDGETFENFR